MKLILCALLVVICMVNLNEGAPNGGGSGGPGVSSCSATQTASCCSPKDRKNGLVVTLTCAINIGGGPCSKYPYLLLFCYSETDCKFIVIILLFFFIATSSYCCDNNILQGVSSLINVNALNCVQVL